MKAFTTLGAAVLFLSLGTIVPAFAQEAQQEAKPAQQEKQAKPAQQEKQAKPAQQPKQQAKPAQQQKQAEPEAQAQQAKPAQPKQEAKPAQQQKQANKPAQQEPQTKQAKQEPGKTAGQQPAHQRSAAEEQRQRAVPALRLSARSSGRIPEDRFRTSFGEGHRFVISQPVMVGGYSRFQYGGFWFGFVEPWPEGWYYSDEVYVDYMDGEYFLFNPFYPGVRVAITFVP
ncbi:MAG: hypothetical protein ACHP8B_05070 [Terriglobales bacterium]